MARQFLEWGAIPPPLFLPLLAGGFALAEEEMRPAFCITFWKNKSGGKAPHSKESRSFVSINARESF